MSELELIKNDCLQFMNYNDEFKKYIDTINDKIIYSYNNLIFHILISKDEQNNSSIDIIHLKKIMKRAYKITKNFDKKFNIYLLLSPFQKKFNDDYNKPLDTYNCNSGFTYKYMNNSIYNIFILRKEEYGKVILHELIHHIDKIHSNFKQKNIKRLKDHFKIKTENLDPNESIVEFNATIFTLNQISIEYNVDFYKLFNDELKYSLYKSYLLLELQKKMKDCFWYDKTNIYCYIIFKTIIMYNLLEFMKIYTYPYNDDLITDFLIKYSELPMIIKTNPTKIRKDNSLCFMIYSDL